jgi:enterobacterial common antigen flippase
MSTTFPIKITASTEPAMARCQCAKATLTDARPSQELAQPHSGDMGHAKSSYGQILKSSALVGGSQVANIAMGIVRTKAMAMLLGPAGFGLFGLYGSIQNLTQSIAGMGINSSGVRQIAQAVGSGDSSRIAKTAAVLRRTAIVLGLLGATLLLILSRQVSKLTFGSGERAASVSLLSLAVLLTLVAGGQMALMQGTRRIADLARMNVLGAFFGLCASIPLIYFFRQKGVVPSLISVAAMTILTSWWYSRKVDVPAVGVKLSEVWQEASALLKLGSAFMASNMMTLGVAYFVRVRLLHKVGFEATGLYQSAWTLGGLYVGFILQAMGADFYPRLTARIHDHAHANRLVNEQTLIGLLLAGPGVLATLTFAPLVIALLYSAKFVAAVSVLRWITLGVMLQVITWPMGFIIIAKGKSAVFFCAELAWTIVAIALAWACVESFGLEGAGIAFFGSYVFHCFLIYPITWRLSNFRWSRANGISAFFFLSLAAVVFCGFYALPTLPAAVIGMAALVVSVHYSLRTIVKLIPSDRLPRQMRHLLIGLGIVRAA